MKKFINYFGDYTDTYITKYGITIKNAVLPTNFTDGIPSVNLTFSTKFFRR